MEKLRMCSIRDWKKGHSRVPFTALERSEF
jgi:hypothetical protein